MLKKQSSRWPEWKNAVWSSCELLIVITASPRRGEASFVAQSSEDLAFWTHVVLTHQNMSEANLCTRVEWGSLCSLYLAQCVICISPEMEVARQLAFLYQAQSTQQKHFGDDLEEVLKMALRRVRFFAFLYGMEAGKALFIYLFPLWWHSRCNFCMTR